MKIIFILTFLFPILVSCKECADKGKNSVIIDERCLKIRLEAGKKGKETGVCYDGPLIKGIDEGAIDPDPEKCKALLDEAQKKCDALPPDPNSLKTVSGNIIYKDGKPYAKDGRPICEE